MKITVSTILMAILFSPASVCSASVIFGSGDQAKEWRQLTQTIEVSYEELDAIYDTNTGLLDTAVKSIRGINFEGWTWADNTDINELFGVYLGIPGFPTDAPDTHITSELDSAWAQAIIDIDADGSDIGIFDGLGTLFPNPDIEGVIAGWSRSRSLVNNDPFLSAVVDLVEGSNDFARFQSGPSDTTSVSVGVWLYRKPEHTSASSPTNMVFIFVLSVLFLLKTRPQYSLKSRVNI